MQPLLLTLLIGTTFAMVNAAPAQNKLQRLQAVLEGDDDIAKAQIIGAIFPHLIRGVLGNEVELAAVQEDDDAEVEKFGKLIKKFFKKHRDTIGDIGAGALGGLVGGGGEEEPVKLQDEDDDDAEVQRFSKLFKKLKKHSSTIGTIGGIGAGALGGLVGGGGEEEPVKLQNEDDDDAAARQALLDAIQARVAMMEDDDDDMAKAQILSILKHILG